MVNWTLDVGCCLSSRRHEDNGLFTFFVRRGFFFHSERMDEPREEIIGIETLRVRIDSICRERSIMQTANDCVEPI
jgi:hypothetical protein